MANQDKTLDTPIVPKDDALFKTLNNNKKRKKRKTIIVVTSILLVLAILIAAGISSLQRMVRQAMTFSQGEIVPHYVTTGTISTTVSGSGSLTDVKLTAITVPDGVEITKVKVTANQDITNGDILATVDMASVASAIADLQVKIETLDAQISDARDDSASTRVYAGVTGRVKAIYGTVDADVTDVMYEHGALALLSLDGYMAVTIETDALSEGDTVTVQLSDQEEITGTVEAVVGSKATILVTDNGPEYLEAVTVLDSEGVQLGTGTLSIHSPLCVTGYAGTICNVWAEENEKVYDYTQLFTLKNTSCSAIYQSLLRERAELEKTFLALLTIQQDGAVLAKTDGSIYSVDYTKGSTSVVTVSPDEKMSVTIDVDEADILSLELGLPVTVSVRSLGDKSYEGTLTEINRSSSSSGTYSAEVQLEKAEGMLSGMTAKVNIQIETLDDAILIPIEALHKTSDGAFVYTSYDAELTQYGGRVDVVTGLENDTFVEITSGLGVGDTVYYAEKKASDSDYHGDMYEVHEDSEAYSYDSAEMSDTEITSDLGG